MNNFRPGAAERIELGEDAARAIRQDIIYVWMSFSERADHTQISARMIR
jgi:crotonobetainyl-CoA:carnitine CoA-transferase CaiB-like acyl-CoA transferase